MFNYEYWGLTCYPSSLQMALEEYFFREGKPSIRFYSFPRDSVVLGYAQATDVLKTRDHTFDLVRRATGGSHVQVGSNVLAYSFAVPRDGFRNFEEMRAYYAEKIGEALEDLGVTVTIDNRASTINYQGRVIASHAVIWGVKSALLHGIVIIDPYNMEKLETRLRLQTRKIGDKEYTEYQALKQLPAISNLLNNIGRNASEEERTSYLKKLLAETILSKVDKNPKKQTIDHKIILKSRQLLERKYGTLPWTESHNPTFTKDEVETIPGEELSGSLKRNLGYCLFLQVKDKDFKKMAEPSD